MRNNNVYCATIGNIHWVFYILDLYSVLKPFLFFVGKPSKSIRLVGEVVIVGFLLHQNHPGDHHSHIGVGPSFP